MSDHPFVGQSASLPTAREAAESLATARLTMVRSRRAAVQTACRAPLVYWGIVWIIGYAGAQFLSSLGSTALWLALIVGIMTLNRVHPLEPPTGLVVSGWERRVRLAWLILVVSSFALTAIVSSAPGYAQGLLSGALWGVAAMLYGALTDDAPVGILGAGIVALAVILRLVAPGLSLVLFGLGAGGGMTALGIAPTRRP